MIICYSACLTGSWSAWSHAVIPHSTICYMDFLKLGVQGQSKIGDRWRSLLLDCGSSAASIWKPGPYVVSTIVKCVQAVTESREIDDVL